MDDDPAFRAKLLDMTGHRTVPQILIDDRPVGGYVELLQLDRSGQLEQPARRRSDALHPLSRVVPRPAPGSAKIFSIGVPQRWHGSPARP